MDEEEVLDLGPRHHVPRGVLAAVTVLLVAGLIWFVARRGDNSTTDAGPAPSTPPPVSASSTAPARALSPFEGGSPREQLLSYVYERAHDHVTAHDSILSDTASGSCTHVPAGVDPSRRLTRYVAATFPRAALLDVARTIDKFAGLCVLELRAQDDTGTVLVVRIVAPIEDAEVVQPRVDEGDAAVDGTITQFVRVSTRAGWIVTAGTSGPSDSGPARSTLLTVANEPSLLW